MNWSRNYSSSKEERRMTIDRRIANRTIDRRIAEMMGMMSSVS